MKIQYVFREANRAADFMATKGHEVDLGVCFFEVPPLGLGSLLTDDMVGVAFPRLFSLVCLFCFGRFSLVQSQKKNKKLHI